MISHGKEIKVFAGNSNRPLAESICSELYRSLGNAAVSQFADGECSISVYEPVRGKDVFIVQSTCDHVNDNLMELLIMIDAMRRASAGRITAVMPYFGYARQDRKAKSRDPISAKLVANLLTAAGVDRVMTCDLHADQIQGFFDIPVDHVYASKVFIPYIKSLNIEDLAIAAPDMGGAKRANAYSRILSCPMIICHKSRTRPNVVGSMTAIGDVEGRNIIIVDDMVDTAGTLCKAAGMLMEKGAKSVRAVATHAVLSGSAYENIANSALTELIVSDTIPLRCSPETDTSKIKVLSVANLFGDIIDKVYNYQSISNSFIF